MSNNNKGMLVYERRKKEAKGKEENTTGEGRAGLEQTVGGERERVLEWSAIKRGMGERNWRMMRAMMSENIWERGWNMRGLSDILRIGMRESFGLGEEGSLL